MFTHGMDLWSNAHVSDGDRVSAPTVPQQSVRTGAWPEELPHGHQQPSERQHDEHHLVDVVLARRQLADQVCHPEQRVEPEREPRPPLPAAKRHQRQKPTEQAYPDRRQPVSAIQQDITGHGHHRHDHTKGQDADTDHKQADPPNPDRDLFASHPADPTAERTRRCVRRARTWMTGFGTLRRMRKRSRPLVQVAQTLPAPVVIVGWSTPPVSRLATMLKVCPPSVDSATWTVPLLVFASR